MESIFMENLRELKKNLQEIEKKLELKISIEGKKVTILGSAIKEYEGLMTLEAIKFGFSAKKSLQLLDEDFSFVKIPIKKFTRRKNLKDVRARIIGREGKTKRTLETLSDSDIIINEKENEIGIICHAESIEEAKTAVQRLIHGSKEANVYRFLEKMNAERKKRDI